jgi:hypothetical protein
MANQVLNSARRHFMAGSGGIALCAGLPLGASAQLPRKDKGRAEEQLLFVSERWEALPGSVGRTPGCVLGTILPGQGRFARNMNTFRWTQQKSCRACRPLSLVVGMGASALIYNAATRKASPIDAPDGFLFTGAAASLPGGAAAVGLRHDFSLGVERAGVGLIEGSGADSVSLHELAGGPVVELAWSSPTDQLLVIQQLLGKPGPYQVSGLKLSPLTVHWNQVLEFGLRPRTACDGSPPEWRRYCCPLSGSSPVPTAGNEAPAPDLDGPMDRAALMRGRVERPAQLVWIDHGRAAIVLEIPSTVPMRGLGTITYTESADVIACTFWDSDVVILLRGSTRAISLPTIWA